MYVLAYITEDRDLIARRTITWPQYKSPVDAPKIYCPD